MTTDRPAASATINLFKVVSAVLARSPGPLVTDRTNFPTDRSSRMKTRGSPKPGAPEPFWSILRFTGEVPEVIPGQPQRDA